MTPVESDEDLTRKQRREQARSERKALEIAEAASAVRRTRLTQIGIVIAVVIVAVVVILIASGSSSSKKPPAVGSSGATKASSEVASLLNGIPQSGGTLGSPNAPVTLQYFGDLECPICRDFTLGALPSLIQNWVRAGKLRIEYRNLETATREPEVFKTQQIAALAAGKQQKAWYYIETFYHEQGEENTGYVTESFLQGIAQQVPGLNLAQWTAARGEPSFANQISSDAQASNAAGFTGTPSFLIGRTSGSMAKFEAPSMTDPSAFNEEIEKLLKA